MAKHDNVYLDPSNYGGRRILAYFLSVIFMMNAVVNCLKYLNSDKLFALMLAILFLLISILYVLQIFWPQIFKQPSLRVTDDKIHIRKKHFGRQTIIPLKEISGISLKSYEIEFAQSGEIIKWEYQTDKDISLRIKSLIREFAERNQIPIDPAI